MEGSWCTEEGKSCATKREKTGSGHTVMNGQHGTKDRGQGREVQGRGGEPAKGPLITLSRSPFLSRKEQARRQRDEGCPQKARLKSQLDTKCHPRPPGASPLPWPGRHIPWREGGLGQEEDRWV